MQASAGSLFLGVLVMGCPDATVSVETHQTTTTTVSAPAPVSAPPAPVADPVVATVLGKKLTLSVLEAIGPEAVHANTPEALLRVGVGVMLATEEARRAGVESQPNQNAWDHVKRFLDRAYNPATTCRNLGEEALGAAWKIHRRAYVHPDMFDVVDVQMICCPRGKAPCVNDPEVDACMQEGVLESERVFAALASRSESREMLLSAAASLQKANPRIGVVEYTFAYDFDFAHHEQPGKWVVMDPALISAVRGARDGEVIAPTRSAYGHHVLYLVRHRKKSVGSPEDPAIKESLRSRACDALVERTRWRYLDDLTAHVHFETMSDAIPTVEGLLNSREVKSTKGQIPLKVHTGAPSDP